MNVKLFVKDNCPRCPEAKRACDGLDGLEVYNVGEMEGLAEAAFHNVLATPTVLVVDADGNELASWRGESPDRKALFEMVAQ